MKRKFHQGFFTPKFPEKYIGDKHQIVYRSSLELHFMNYFDKSSNIIKWGSEEIFIPYLYEVDGIIHRYFPDFIIEYKSKDGIKKAIVEIKPRELCAKPRMPKKGKTRGYINRVNEHIKNENKWNAAKTYCKKKNMKFFVLTEQDLNVSRK